MNENGSFSKYKEKNSKVIKEVNILLEVGKSVCCIRTNDNEKLGTGFFIKFYKGKNPLYCLITCKHVIPNKLIAKKNKIKILYSNKSKSIDIILDKDKRLIKNYKYLNIDAIIISIFNWEVEEKYFLLPDKNNIGDYSAVLNKKISILQYPGDGDLSESGDIIIKVNEFSKKFYHKSPTKNGSSGSPIFLEGSKYVIGIHLGRTNDVREANFIGPIIISLEKDIKYKIISHNNRLYEGDIIGADGNGRITGEDVEYYFGEWKNWEKVGKGIIYYKPNKIKYEGNFKNDLYYRTGKLIKKNGDYSIGNFFFGSLFGKGISYDKNGNKIYEGDFAFGQFEGNGKEYHDDYEIEGIYEDGEIKKEFLVKIDDAKIVEFHETKNVTIFYKYGIKYVGEVRDNRIEGFGALYYNNKKIYEGGFKNFEREGKGIQIENNILFEGEFKNNKKNGDFICYKDEKIFYKGPFVNDIMEGYGEYHEENGTYYKGELKNNEYNGIGELYDKKGNIIYIGYFKDGYFEGNNSILRLIDDNCYLIGSFKSGLPNKGQLYDFNDKLLYDGHFVNGMFEGENEIIYGKKGYYIGSFKKGEQNGHGSYFDYTNKLIYDGEFKDGKYDGIGKLYDDDNNQYYEGEFKSGKKSGKGKIYKNGVLVGDCLFMNDKLEGQNLVYDDIGDLYVGQFQNDDVVGNLIKFKRINKDKGVLGNVISKCLIF